jgi:hypothetical protein
MFLRCLLKLKDLGPREYVEKVTGFGRDEPYTGVASFGGGGGTEKENGK